MLLTNEQSRILLIYQHIVTYCPFFSKMEALSQKKKNLNERKHLFLPPMSLFCSMQLIWNFYRC
jgi:hypothetical protein